MHRGDIDQAQTMLEDLPVNAGLDPAVKKLQAQLGFARAAQNADPVALKRFIESKPDDLEARYRLGACKVMRGEYEEALEQFFQIMRRDRGFEHDAGRKGMLAVFELLGGSGELVSRYRAKMVNVLH
jgi:putative thioredoxin